MQGEAEDCVVGAAACAGCDGSDRMKLGWYVGGYESIVNAKVLRRQYDSRPEGEVEARKREAEVVIRAKWWWMRGRVKKMWTPECIKKDDVNSGRTMGWCHE